MSNKRKSTSVTDDAEVLANTRELLKIYAEVVDSVSTLKKWTRRSGGWWAVLLRCVLRRQYENMDTVVDLVERGRGHCCVSLLRSACEELLWLKFLKTISTRDRELIIQAKVNIEVGDSIHAQHAYLGDAGMKEIGFSPEFIAGARKNREHMRQEMKTVGKRLGWKTGRRLFPTAAYIAGMVGEKELYDLIYHATSRTVHFNVSELFRRAWGNDDELKITSDDMNRYWSRFALFWGTYVLAMTSAEILEEFSEDEWSMGESAEVNLKALESLLEKTSKSGYVPIITAQELNLHISPERRPKW
jgi:hypothetical protein